MNVINHVLRGTAYRVTSPFGMRTLTIGGRQVTHMHNGIDLISPTIRHAEVIAMARGRVIRVVRNILESQTPTIIAQAQTTLYFGNLVFVEHANNVVTRYTHLQSGSIPAGITVGAIVEKGQLLGLMGTTGYSTGVHLHFEVVENGNRVDPAPYLLGQKNVIDLVTNVPINREGLPTLTVTTTNLRLRKAPNGELVGTLPQGAILPYLGKSSLISGHEWAEVVHDNQIVYCALNTTWNTLNHAVREVVRTVEVIKEVPVDRIVEVVREVVRPIDETFEKNGISVRVVVS